MASWNISIRADGQALTCESLRLASDTIAEVTCSFTLSSEWSDFDSVSAIFKDKFGKKLAVPIVSGSCTIPWEVLTERGDVRVNLCGYTVTGTTKTLQLTSFSTVCVKVLQKVEITGRSSEAPSVAQWQQALNAHANSSEIHTTAQEKATWNAKLSDAPSDGKQYARKDGEWAEVQGGGGSTSWNDITDKPATFPPSAHDQSWSTITGKPESYPPSSHTHSWDSVTDKPSTFTPSAHNHDDLYYGKSYVDTALAGKQATLPSAVNNKYLHANASTGALEWADAQGGGGSEQFFVCNPSTTFAQAAAAYDAGKLLVCKYDDGYAVQTSATTTKQGGVTIGGSFTFQSVVEIADIGNCLTKTTLDSDDGWEYSYEQLPSDKFLYTTFDELTFQELCQQVEDSGLMPAVYYYDDDLTYNLAYKDIEYDWDAEEWGGSLKFTALALSQDNRFVVKSVICDDFDGWATGPNKYL